MKTLFLILLIYSGTFAGVGIYAGIGHDQYTNTYSVYGISLLKEGLIYAVSSDILLETPVFPGRFKETKLNIPITVFRGFYGIIGNSYIIPNTRNYGFDIGITIITCNYWKIRSTYGITRNSLSIDIAKIIEWEPFYVDQ
jgi:hypothetical protein